MRWPKNSTRTTRPRRDRGGVGRRASRAAPLSDADRAAHRARDRRSRARSRDLATSITHNAKGEALLKALHVAFAKADGARRGAEGHHLHRVARRPRATCCACSADSPWQDGIVLFNGSNTDDRSKAIYAGVAASRHQGTDRVTGSRTADMRSALVDYFRDEGQIMIATEAGAEGINLQFCSLVVNYDLPWNPQRIEQRIGRCHRYGQKHDVVVVNFLNRKNDADQRVFELLAEKFKLFEGVFGASDEVLGAIESGVDFEKRIATIYQQLPEDRRDQGRLRPAAAGAEFRDQRGDEPHRRQAAGELRRRGAREAAGPQDESRKRVA